MKKIYLDYSATSPVDPQVVKAMLPYFANKFGNPSSLHSWGQEAKKAVEKSRQQVANLLGCLPKEIIFTSGATEANNLALKGVVEAWQKDHPGQKPHLIVSVIEHHCVLNTAKHLGQQGAEINWLKVDQDGLVDPNQVLKLIKSNTVLVCVMFANNEIGTIEPIREISLMVKKYKGFKKYPLIQTDAVQALQYLDCQVNHLGVDLLSASSHKFSGPKGVGFLYVRTGTRLIRQQDGGEGQEWGRRSGTENVAGIVGLGKALELAKKNREREVRRLTKLRDYLIENCVPAVALRRHSSEASVTSAKAGQLSVVSCQLTGHPTKRLPHLVSFVIPGAEGEAMLLHLNDQGIAASSGSACTAGDLRPSHVLLSLGIKPEIAHGSLRFSLGKETTKKDLDYVIKVLPGIVKKLREMAPD